MTQTPVGGDEQRIVVMTQLVRLQVVRRRKGLKKHTDEIQARVDKI